MPKLFRKDAKEILAMVNSIPAPTELDIDRAKVAAITCKSTKEFCDFLNLEPVSFRYWCSKYPKYEKAIMSWRSSATNEIEMAMAKRAIGFTKTTKRDVITKAGQIETLSIETYYPPSEAAGQFWLKNRAPADWQDKKEIDVNVNANIRAWLVAAGPMDPSETLAGAENLITDAIYSAIEDKTEENAENAILAEVVAEVEATQEIDLIVNDTNLTINDGEAFKSRSPNKITNDDTAFNSVVNKGTFKW